MKPSALFIIVIGCFLASSCENNDLNPYPRPEAIIGSWRSEAVYLNEVKSDFFSRGSLLFFIKEDNSFNKLYLNGTWNLQGHTLRIERGAEWGLEDWVYQVVDYSDNMLTLELRLTEGQYCCDFDEFEENEIITIREVYSRIPND